MGYNYNGKLKSAELLLKEDGSVQMIRRAETPEDYFATFDFCDMFKKADLCADSAIMQKEAFLLQSKVQY